MSHPFGSGPPPIFVPEGFVFPDASKSSGAAQPDGAVQGAPTNDTVDGRIVTMTHPEGGV